MVGLEGRVDDLEQALGRDSVPGVDVPEVDRLGIARGLAHHVAVNSVVASGNTVLGHDGEGLADPPVEIVRVGGRGLGRGLGRRGGLRLGAEAQCEAGADDRRVVTDGGPVRLVELLPAAVQGMVRGDLRKGVTDDHGIGRGRRGHRGRRGYRLDRRDGRRRRAGSDRACGGRADQRECEGRATCAGEGQLPGDLVLLRPTVLTLCRHGGIPHVGGRRPGRRGRIRQLTTWSEVTVGEPAGREQAPNSTDRSTSRYPPRK